MNLFENIIGRRINSIQRIDQEEDYAVYQPYAIILGFEDLDNKFLISATNDGHSIDLRITADDEIDEQFGLEDYETVLNNLTKEDELNLLINNRINNLKIAQYSEPEIKGNDFVINQGKYAGICIVTDKHILNFHNNYGGWYDIDDEDSEFPNRERWDWK